jgi:hypothetical protein
MRDAGSARLVRSSLCKPLHSRGDPKINATHDCLRHDASLIEATDHTSRIADGLSWVLVIP